MGAHPVAQALAALLEGAVSSSSLAATVFDSPPFTLNPNSIVVGQPTEVLYTGGDSGFGIDEATLPVLCVAGQDQDDTVSALLVLVRDTVDTSENLDAVVQQLHAVSERNWRHVNVAGADLLVAEMIIQVLM